MKEDSNAPQPSIAANPNKGGDPRKDIYIHSKVILIDHAFGMLGSANHNERSMWHDSEDMLAFRSSERYDLVGNIQKELMGCVLSGDLPSDFDGETIFAHFGNHINYNTKNHEKPKSLLHHLAPGTAMGVTLIS